MLYNVNTELQIKYSSQNMAGHNLGGERKLEWIFQFGSSLRVKAIFLTPFSIFRRKEIYI